MKIVLKNPHFVLPIYIEGVVLFYKSSLFFYKLSWFIMQQPFFIRQITQELCNSDYLIIFKKSKNIS
jgi:hypothetical protein